MTCKKHFENRYSLVSTDSAGVSVKDVAGDMVIHESRAFMRDGLSLLKRIAGFGSREMPWEYDAPQGIRTREREGMDR